jgi:Holliday junction resolvase RusA-like endonuclease
MMELWVPGRPKTKGSLNFTPGPRCRCCSACRGNLPGQGRVTENVVGSKDWRAMMAYQVRQYVEANPGPWPLRGRVGVAARYALPVADATATRSGDLDKLARNTLDALTDAGAYGDDVQVTRLLLEKVPEGASGEHGMALSVVALS